MNTKYLYTNVNNYAPIVTPSSQDTPLSKQSKKYKKYQTNLVSDIKHTQLYKENYQNLENSQNLERQAKHVYHKTYPTSSEVSSNQQLLDNYESTLTSYQTLLMQTMAIMKSYSDSVNSDINPYLGKNIQFSNGTVAYVTNAGIVKPYSGNIYNSTAGQNGCPSNSPIPIKIPWQNSFLTPNTVISQRPSLVAGTQMIAGQSCGNEGTNILVNGLLGSNVTPSVSYQGCYKDSYETPVMNYLSSVNSTDISANQIYSFEDCQNSAIMNNYNYFGLQNVNPTTNLGVCAISNDFTTATSLGQSNYTTTTTTQLVPYTLWSSGTTTGASATLNSCGQIQVMDSSGNVLFSAPEDAGPPPTYSNGQIYYAYLAPSCNPLNPNVGSQYNGNYNITIDTQLTTWYGTGVWWWPPEIEGVSYPPYGYQQQSSGPELIYDGAYTVLNATYPNLVANPNFVATNGKTGINSMEYGTILSPGEFIGNAQGSLYLIMDTDGNLKLNTSVSQTTTSNIPNCAPLFNSDYYGGGDSTNAIYNVTPVGNKSLLNNVFYVSPNAQLYSFPSSDTQLTSNYTTYSNYDTSNNDLGNPISGTLDQCQTSCNSNTSCAGLVYDISNNTCSLKSNEMWPYGSGTAAYNQNKSIYIKNNSITQAPPGIPMTIANNIDSITATNYGAVQGNVSESSQEETLVQDQIAIRNNIISLQQMEDTLNTLSQELINNNVAIENNLLLVIQQSMKDKKSLENMLNQINKIESINPNSSLDNILEDSQIKTTQENYSYILWSIVGIGVIVFAISVLRKK
jgi:hypothetical protein